ncbi:uncharacterized protein BXIN_0135 [Babesia sp. Xinjiang]|uniref:uncharacterized protein n=1 Tax=Babesia sp. Xinjiang TaxID=462227 RepID=UPI000A246470|nr:uncharacterized protein BXIN_0135 [Babesia sp. Xinjiang]ORM39721.1 hypothetical protein BXIN_0135 [Babesia sp. Xinjiang]
MAGYSARPMPPRPTAPSQGTQRPPPPGRAGMRSEAPPAAPPAAPPVTQSGHQALPESGAMPAASPHPGTPVAAPPGAPAPAEAAPTPAKAKTIVQRKQKLTDCPTNVKEAMDWILRLTNKDGTIGGQPDKEAINELAGELLALMKETQTYIKGRYKRYSSEDKRLIAEVIKALESDTKYTGMVSVGSLDNDNIYGGVITQLSTSFNSLVGWIGMHISGLVLGKVKASPEEGYLSAYDKDATWKNAKTEKDGTKICAKIFLGCIPLLFTGITYLYWQCSHGNDDSGGKRWVCDVQRHAGGSSCQELTNPDGNICNYLQSIGFPLEQLNDNDSSNRDANFLVSIIKDFFPEFDSRGNRMGFRMLSGDIPPVDQAYSSFIKTLLVNSKLKDSEPSSEILASLYFASKYYFQAQHYTPKYKKDEKKRLPATIREMLYWLMTLPYTPFYRSMELEGLEKILKIEKGNNVEFIKGKNPRECISIDLINTHYRVLSTCSYSSIVLMAIQGGLDDKETRSDPLIVHKLLTNTHFSFYYPLKEKEWFELLWDIVSDLYLQIKFLSEQCMTCVTEGCGWKWCQYGSGVSCKNILSWICGATTEQGGVLHSCVSDGCNQSHNEHVTSKGQCSPLQAFLCDNLTNFICRDTTKKGYTIYQDHITHRVQRQWCPIPLGFKQSDLPSVPRNGNCLEIILDTFCYSKTESVSLFNLIMCLMGFMVKTPRSLGDLFGFFYSLGESTDNIGTGDKGPIMKTELEDTIKYYSWNSSHTFNNTDIVSAVKTLSGNADSASHRGPINHPADFKSIHGCYIDKCGSYIAPLRGDIYSVFHTKYAHTYLAWIVYLADYLCEGIKDLINKFKKVKCKYCDHIPQCEPGCHEIDKDNDCKCQSVVKCAAVLELYHRYGFGYSSASELHGTSSKKTCEDFFNQVKAVYEGIPLAGLNSAVNNFLLHIRFYFILYQAAFWILLIAYFIYGILMTLDLIYIRSHWRLALSHQVPSTIFLSNQASPNDAFYFKL